MPAKRFRLKSTGRNLESPLCSGILVLCIARPPKYYGSQIHSYHNGCLSEADFFKFGLQYFNDFCGLTTITRVYSCCISSLLGLSMIAISWLPVSYSVFFSRKGITVFAIVLLAQESLILFVVVWGWDGAAICQRLAPGAFQALTIVLKKGLKLEAKSRNLLPRLLYACVCQNSGLQKNQ